jgi:hypothetical protein
MKHKHADLIHAWADGAEIQWKNTNDVWEDWANDEVSPPWHPYSEYRIKPEEKKPVVRWLWADKFGQTTSCMYTEAEAKGTCHPIKLEWSRTEFPE